MTPTTSEREARELLKELDDYLQDCPDPIHALVPKWMVRKPSRLLWRCRAIIAALTRQEAQQDRCDGSRPLAIDRDLLGRLVREEWVRWASEQPNPKPSWLVPYDELPESDKEADRRIGECAARWAIVHDACAASQQEAPYRNLPDEATFEDYRDQLACGNLTAIDQIAFDNMLHDRLQPQQEAQQECPKCGGTGGERWHEADGSENGARCDACDGFGTQQEAQGAVYEWRKDDVAKWTVLGNAMGITPPAPVDVRKPMSRIIELLAQLVNAPQTDDEFDADMLRREIVMEKVCQLRLAWDDLSKAHRALLDGQPAGVVIDDAMVERAINARIGVNSTVADMLRHPDQHNRGWKVSIMRAALQAALGGGGRG